MSINQLPTNSNQLPVATRPPVVVIVGHVDHGKTAILSYIRKVKVPQEAGGITQHIGAYQVEHHGRIITFLDTPGHEAFSAVRSRGAKVADIGILVVAADEGVKTQTVEAIEHLKASGIPFIVAINKMDKQGANPNKVKQELAEYQVFVEGWGGNISTMEVSAKNGQGMEELLELLLLTADVAELHLNQEGPAEGVVIDSRLDAKRGYVATLLIQKGVLDANAYVVSGRTWAKIKALEDFRGQAIDSATSGQPAMVLGWSEAPDIGEKFKQVLSRADAQRMAQQATKTAKPLFVRPPAGLEQKTLLDLVIKADVPSSLEAVDEAIKNIIHTEVAYRIVDYGLGNITENDIQKAAVNKGMIYGFHVGASTLVQAVAQRHEVRVKTFEIIYELVEALRKDISRLLPPEIKKMPLASIKILEIFQPLNGFQIIGGRVFSGVARRGAIIDVLRSGEIKTTGRLAQLQQNKQDVSEVREGSECGIKFEELPGKPKTDIQPGDILEVYEEEKVERSL